MSSSSAAAASEAAADDITFPPTSAPAATVTSYMATDESRGNSGYSGNSGNSGNYGMDQGGSPSNAGGSGDNYRQTHGTCKYYPTLGDSKCQMQRSCYDCLNFNISTETYGCMINTVGVCTRLDGYDPALDFRLGHASNNETYFANYSSGSTSGSGASATVGDGGENEQYQFLASVATYCDQDDAECRSCIDNQFADVVYGNSGNSRSKFCYGQGGCVCVAICEALRLNPPHMDKECFANTMSANEKSQGTNYGSVFMIVGAMMMVVVVVLAIYRIRKRGELPLESEGGSGDSKDPNAVNRRPSGADSPVITPENNASPIAVAMPVPTVTTKGTLLNLFNWAAMREVLIQHEQMRLEGIDEHALSPVDVDAKSDVQFLDVKPSAPEDDTEMPTAPAIPIVTVATAPPVMTVRAMASAPSAPDFDDLDDLDAADMTHL